MTSLEAEWYRGVYTGKPIGDAEQYKLHPGEVVRYKGDLWAVEYCNSQPVHYGRNEHYSNPVFAFYKLIRYTQSMAKIEQFITQDDLVDVTIPSSVESMAPESTFYSKNYLSMIGKSR